MDHDQTLTSENTLPSTPPPAVFSDDANRPSSPPSSPPGFPWEYDNAPNNAPKAVPQPPQKSAFSLLGKRKVLSSISDNARPTKKRAIATKQSEKSAMTQMQISLGQQVRKRCKTCGMEYVLSSAEDRKMHDKYHKQNTEGYDVGKDFARNARDGTTFEGRKKGDAICLVDFRDKPGRRAKAQAILDIVQRELGAVEIDENGIWDVDKQNDQDPNYQSYLYLRGTKCVGYLLVERIREAREVIAPEARASIASENDPTITRKASNATKALQKRREAATKERYQAETSPIELSKVPTHASLGVSRIWTSSLHRRQNVASLLLDAALRCHCQRPPTEHNDGQTDDRAESQDRKSTRNEASSKELVAFSQPTESGARLARRWFGKTYGWKVYVD